jgi:SPP1 family predicted phage head-tail adaptor
MNIGELDKRIEIIRLATSTDEDGFSTTEPVVLKKVWAKVQNLYGREYYQAASVQQENTVKFTIRYLTELDQTMQIRFNNKIYDIKSIDNIKYQNKFIEIKAIEGVLNEG